jgi:hypothetical protein
VGVEATRIAIVSELREVSQRLRELEAKVAEL